jgi:tetratricopeptide (TPR) repeat protein
MSRGRAAEYQTRLLEAKELYRSGSYAKAREALRSVLALGEQLWGPDAPHLIDALNWLAMALGERKYDGTVRSEELALHERVLRISNASFGLDDVRTAEAIERLALDHWGMRRLEESRRGYRKALTIMRRHLDDESYRVRGVLMSLGALLVEMGRAKAAMRYLKKEARFADASGHAVSRVIAHRMLGRAFLDMGRGADAVASLQLAVDLAAARATPPHLLRELRRWLREAKNSSGPKKKKTARSGSRARR